MEISSKIIQILPLQTGFSKNGQWRKQDIIVETDDQYPKKICISIWGDKINEKQLVIGNILAISFDLESREYNGKWYTDVKATKINLIEEIPAKISTLDTKNAVDEEEVEEGIPF